MATLLTEPGFPCSYCGVNATTACRHRPAETGPRPEALAAQARSRQGRKARSHPGVAGRSKKPYPGYRKGWGYEDVE